MYFNVLLAPTVSPLCQTEFVILPTDPYFFLSQFPYSHVSMDQGPKYTYWNYRFHLVPRPLPRDAPYQLFPLHLCQLTMQMCCMLRLHHPLVALISEFR